MSTLHFRPIEVAIKETIKEITFQRKKFPQNSTKIRRELTKRACQRGQRGGQATESRSCGAKGHPLMTRYSHKRSREITPCVAQSVYQLGDYVRRRERFRVIQRARERGKNARYTKGKEVNRSKGSQKSRQIIPDLRNTITCTASTARCFACPSSFLFIHLSRLLSPCLRGIQMYVTPTSRCSPTRKIKNKNEQSFK